MKQFNLEEYLKNPNKKVVTRDGRSARIVCVDAKGGYPVVAMVLSIDGTLETPHNYTKNGHFDNNAYEYVYDLFLLLKSTRDGLTSTIVTTWGSI